MTRLRSASRAFLLLSLVAAGCGDDDGGGTTEAGVDGAMEMGDVGETGRVRIWHLAPNAPNVDVFVDGALAGDGNIAFEENTQYLDVPAGERAFAVAPAGAGVDGAILNLTANIAAGSRQTVVAIQTNQDATADGAFALLVVDESAADAAAGVNFRFFHASFAVAGPVGIYDAAAPDTLLGTVNQGEAISAPINLPVGSYAFGIDIDADGAIDLVMDPALDAPPEGTNVLLGVLTKPDDGDFETEAVFIVGEGVHDEAEFEEAGEEETALVRVWHLAAEAGNVDVFVDGTAVESDFAFEENTPYLEVPAGERALAVSAAGAGVDAAILNLTANLVAGSRQTVVAIQVDGDEAAAGAFELLVVDESAEAAADQLTFHFFHAAFAVPNAVRLFDTANPAASAGELAQGEALAAPVTLPVAAYTFGLDVSNPLDDVIDLQTAAPIDAPPAGTRVTVGVISKPDGAEVETEVVFIVGEGVHDEVELEAAE